MGTFANMVIPKPEVWIAPVDTAFPTITGTLGGTVTMTGFTEVGFLGEGTKAGVEFSAERRKFRPMNKLAPIGAQTIARGAMLSLTLAESDLTKWATALATTLDGNDILNDGDDEDLPFVQVAIVTTTKVLRFRKMASDGNAKVDMDDTTEEQPQVVLEAYEYEAGDAGERIWKWYPRTA